MFIVQEAIHLPKGGSDLPSFDMNDRDPYSTTETVTRFLLMACASQFGRSIPKQEELQQKACQSASLSWHRLKLSGIYIHKCLTQEMDQSRMYKGMGTKK